jgi:hypothetical protein
MCLFRSLFGRRTPSISQACWLRLIDLIKKKIDFRNLNIILREMSDRRYHERPAVEGTGSNAENSVTRPRAQRSEKLSR